MLRLIRQLGHRARDSLPLTWMSIPWISFPWMPFPCMPFPCMPFPCQVVSFQRRKISDVLTPPKAKLLLITFSASILRDSPRI